MNATHTRRAAAYVVAARAVAAVVARMDVDHAAVNPDGVTGYVKFARDVSLVATDLAYLVAAGRAASELSGGADPDPHQSGWDASRAAEAAMRHTGHDRAAASAILCNWAANARRVVGQCRLAVERVAAVLVERGRVSGEHVRRIVGPTNPNTW